MTRITYSLVGLILIGLISMFQSMAVASDIDRFKSLTHSDLAGSLNVTQQFPVALQVMTGANAIPVRSAPSTASDILSLLPPQTEITLDLGITGTGWIRVVTPGSNETGFVFMGWFEQESQREIFRSTLLNAMGMAWSDVANSKVSKSFRLKYHGMLSRLYGRLVAPSEIKSHLIEKQPKPIHGELLGALATAYARLGDIEKAKEYFDKATGVYPRLSQDKINYALAIAHAHDNKWKEMDASLEKLSSPFLERETLGTLADVLIRQGEYRRSLFVLRKSTHHIADYYASLVFQQMVDAGKYKEAVQLRKEFPNLIQSWDIKLLQAIKHVEAGQLSEGINFINLNADELEKQPMVLALADWLIDVGRYKEAEVLARDTPHSNRDDVRFNSLLIQARLAFAHENNPKKAKTLLDRAKQALGEAGTIQNELRISAFAKLVSELGPDKSVVAFIDGLTADTDSYTYWELRQRLKSSLTAIATKGNGHAALLAIKIVEQSLVEARAAKFAKIDDQIKKHGRPFGLMGDYLFRDQGWLACLHSVVSQGVDSNKILASGFAQMEGRTPNLTFTKQMVDGVVAYTRSGDLVGLSELFSQVFLLASSFPEPDVRAEFLTHMLGGFTQALDLPGDIRPAKLYEQVCSQI